jgi:hypothetical protein
VDWDGGLGGGEVQRQDLVDGEILRGEDAVEAFERERALSIEEVGDMRLLKACLLGEAAAGEGPALDAAEEFQAEEFVEVLEVHSPGGFLWKLMRRGVPWRTISFDKTKIRQKFYFMQ